MKKRTLDAVSLACLLLGLMGGAFYLTRRADSEVRREFRLYLNNQIALSEIVLQRAMRYSDAEAKTHFIDEEQKRLASDQQCLTNVNDAQPPSWQMEVGLFVLVVGNLGAYIAQVLSRKKKTQ